jgi:hypothetical protein
MAWATQRTHLRAELEALRDPVDAAKRHEEVQRSWQRERDLDQRPINAAEQVQRQARDHHAEADRIRDRQASRPAEQRRQLSQINLDGQPDGEIAPDMKRGTSASPPLASQTPIPTRAVSSPPSYRSMPPDNSIDPPLPEEEQSQPIGWWQRLRKLLEAPLGKQRHLLD